MSEIAEVYDALKQLQKANTKELLLLLQNGGYSLEWVAREINTKSMERKITRRLDILVEMNLVEKSKKGKTNTYSIVHNYPVKSDANKYISQLQEIISQDKSLFIQAQKPLEQLMNEIKSPYYIRQNVEDISAKEMILKTIELAINEHHYLEVQYKDKNYTVRALKIAEFEGIWYLLLYLDRDKSYRKFRIIEIQSATISKEHFNSNFLDTLDIDAWHNVWYDPNKKPLHVKLWIDDSKLKYFYQKNIFNINNYPQRIKEYKDGVEYDTYITDTREIRSELMYWLPHVLIVEEDEKLNLKNEILEILATMQRSQV